MLCINYHSAVLLHAEQEALRNEVHVLRGNVDIDAV